jgi:hypothetical protein
LDPFAEYSRRLEASRLRAAEQTRRDEALGNARLGVFLAGIGLAALAYWQWIAWWWTLAALVGFAVLVFIHGRAIRARKRAEGIVAYHERALKRLDGTWPGTGSSGERFLDEEHPYASDLDLFGVGSLFERLCTARTASGEAVLAGWLLAPADPSEIRERQGAIAELRTKLDFREDMALLGDDVRSGVAPEALAAWGSSAHRRPPIALRVALGLLAAVTGASVVAYLGFGLNGWVVIGLFAVEAAVGFGLGRLSGRALEEVEERASELTVLAGLLDRVEREPFASSRLQALRAPLDDGRKASERIARLARLVRWLEARHNVYFALFGAMLLWKTQLALAIEKWRAEEGPAIGGWLEVVGQFEAYLSLATYAFENPDDPFPEVVETGPILEGEGLGHPLLPPSSCVRNDLKIGGELRVLAVSGSNMSGKSTWLRTVGVNTVLGQAGAPVHARRMKLSPLAIGGTLRVHDSLQAGRSRFYAEILRLRQLVDLAGKTPPLLFLIDEILHGTNSHDRLQGAEAVVKGLIDRGAIGLFTTHDLALAEVAGHLAPRSINVHFADHLDAEGRLAFDYTMRPGVVRQSNAIALMRAVGLEV